MSSVYFQGPQTRKKNQSGTTERTVYFGFSSWSVKGKDRKKETRKIKETGY